MWPRKISMFGKGSGKMETPKPPFNRLDTHFDEDEERRIQARREFMQDAVIAMLANIEHMPVTGRSPEKLAARADELYVAIEDKITHEQ